MTSIKMVYKRFTPDHCGYTMQSVPVLSLPPVHVCTLQLGVLKCNCFHLFYVTWHIIMYNDIWWYVMVHIDTWWYMMDYDDIYDDV